MVSSLKCFSFLYHIFYQALVFFLSDRLIEHGFTSAPTQYRLYGQQFLQVWWPNQQCQSTEGGWL